MVYLYMLETSIIIVLVVSSTAIISLLSRLIYASNCNVCKLECGCLKCEIDRKTEQETSVRNIKVKNI